MKIEVTQSDIDNGLSCDSQYCPIALAVRRAGFTNVNVDESVISVGDGRLFEHDNERFDFLIHFDRNLEVEPFSFDLDIR
jgi:hypothetical protein